MLKPFISKAKKKQTGSNFTQKVLEYNCLLLGIQKAHAFDIGLLCIFLETHKKQCTLMTIIFKVNS